MNRNILKDVVKCIIVALKLAKNRSICKIINVLTGGSVTINELADLIAYQIGVSPEKVYQELPIGDPEVSQGTIEKLAETLDVNPSEFTNLKTGLRDTVQFIREYRPNE